MPARLTGVPAYRGIDSYVHCIAPSSSIYFDELDLVNMADGVTIIAADILNMSGTGLLKIRIDADFSIFDIIDESQTIM